MKYYKSLFILLIIAMQANSLHAQNNITFENPNEHVKIIKSFDVYEDQILYEDQYMPIVIERDSLSRLLKEKETLELKIKEEQQKLVVDKFLNIQDSTIFVSQFIDVPIEEIFPRSRDFYLLVKNIHDLNKLLGEMEKATVLQSSALKGQLTEARNLIDKVNSYALMEGIKITDYLTKPQKQFFGRLVDRYNYVYDALNPND